jgi:methyl-accepting chemotaxis protein
VIIEIAAASEEQTGGIQQVNKAIMQLDEITQQNAALVEEAAAASESMKEQAQQLKEHISFFKTKSEKESLAASKPENSSKLPAAKPKQKPQQRQDTHLHSIANSHQLASSARSKHKPDDDDIDDHRDDNGWVDF